KRPCPSPLASTSPEHIITVVPVKFRHRAVETCFLARPDVSILRQNAKMRHPAISSPPRDPGIRILKLTLAIDDPVEIGPGLLVLSVLSVNRSGARFRMTVSDDLLLNLCYLDDDQELNLRAIAGQLDKGLDYRGKAL